jgi:fatty acid synthase
MAMQVKRFMPFLEGNRQCIGMPLAKLNLTTAVAVLLSHFSFRLADNVSHFTSPLSLPA